MLKYNDNNVFVGQIKQLLNTFNIPSCKVYKDSFNLSLYNGLHLIKDTFIYYVDNGELKRETSYVPGKYYPNLTKSLDISNNIYDSTTHKYLGKYLRFIRDYYNVDLMSMYNCFSNEIVENINNQTEYQSFVGDTDDYVVYAIPAVFDKEYTIGIDCALGIEVFAGFYSRGVIVNYSSAMSTATYSKLSLSLDKPVLYTKLKTFTPTNEMLKNEDILCLFVKIPASCKSSPVILEGDYTKFQKELGSNFSADGEILNYCPWLSTANAEWYVGDPIFIQTFHNDKSRISNFVNIVKPYLLSINNVKGKYLVSDRLMEYLTGNAITKLSEYYDIRKIQKPLRKLNLIDNYYPGIWDDNLSDGILKYISKNELSANYDTIGYIDKDVEEKLGYLDKDEEF